MQNHEIANIFYEIAEMLEILEESRFRIRAYFNAAQAIEALSEDVAALAERGELRKIRGIGESTADKIEEILKTGECKAHQQLLKKIPHGVIEMMDIPGMGPKSAMTVYKELKIDNVEKLEKAAKAGKLAGLPRLGEKFQKKLLKGISYLKKSKGKFKLVTALEYAESIAGELKKLKEVEKLEFAGSLRRKKELVRDVDMLVTSKKPEKIMDVFTSLEDVKQVLAKGATKSSVMLECGLQVDVRVLEPESFGAALCYFTGSKEHNVAVRDLAKRKGMKVSEYGVFKGKKCLASKTEEELFKVLGFKQFIEPELRENQGEIEAAIKGNLPDLVELKDIKGDLHMHTVATDGECTIEEMAQAAKKLGYSYIGIADHSKAVTVAGGMDEKQLLAQMEKIETADKKINGIKILKAIEVDIMKDGALDLDDEVLAKCDVVIGAIHSRFEMKKAEMTKRILNAMENPNMDILAHPTGRLLKERPPYQVDMEKVLRAAADLNVAMELSAYPDRLDLNDGHCRLAKKMGVKICINTDSHNTKHLDNMKYGVFTARRGWLEKKDIINTLPVEKLLGGLR